MHAVLNLRRWLPIVLALAFAMAAAATADAAGYFINDPVAGGVANLRDGPGTSHNIVVGIPPGAPITVSDCRGDDDHTTKLPWCQVSWGDYKGWTSSCCFELRFSADDGRVFQFNESIVFVDRCTADFSRCGGGHVSYLSPPTSFYISATANAASYWEPGTHLACPSKWTRAGDPSKTYTACRADMRDGEARLLLRQDSSPGGQASSTEWLYKIDLNSGACTEIMRRSSPQGHEEWRFAVSCVPVQK